MNWETIWKRDCGNLVLTLQLTTEGWLLIQVYDQSVVPQLKIFEVFYPNLPITKHTFFTTEVNQVLDLIELFWLQTPAFFKQQITSQELYDSIPPSLARFTRFLVTHYFSILKYEHNYDYGVPCDVYDPEFLNPTFYPPLYHPNNFQESQNLLSFSGGKESSTSKLVLDSLGIQYDRFQILSRNDVPLLDQVTPEEWVEQYPQFQCFSGDSRHLGHFHNLQLLYCSYESTSVNQFSDYGRSLGWGITFSQRLFALLYMAIHNYKVLFYGSEYENHQVYRTPQGYFLDASFKQTQFFHNYLARVTPTPYTIVSPITNFTQGACLRVLAETNTKFNSCFHSCGDFNHWCGDCFKCKRVERLLGHLGKVNHNDPQKYAELTNLDPQQFDNYHQYQFDHELLGGFRPNPSQPLFPEMDRIQDADSYFNYLYSGEMHNVWEPWTLSRLARDLDFAVKHDSTLAGIRPHRRPQPEWRI